MSAEMDVRKASEQNYAAMNRMATGDAGCTRPHERKEVSDSP
jgi:hypothetical protein